MPNLIQLLGSKQYYDVIESIRVLIYLHQLNIESAKEGVMKMLVLIWNKEKHIKDELMKAYWNLYMDESQYKPEGVAINLIKLFQKASLNELTSLEELIIQIQKDENENEEKNLKNNQFYISQKTLEKIWEIFLQSQNTLNNNNNQQIQIEKNEISRASIRILRISSSIQNKKKKKYEIFAINKVQSLQEITKKALQNPPLQIDWIILKEILTLLELQAFKNENIIKNMTYLLEKNQGTSQNEWYCASEQLINTIFKQEINPEQTMRNFIVKLTQNLENESLLETQNDTKELIFERKLAHLLFVVGHCALKLLIYVDDIENALKKKRLEKEKKEEENKNDQNNNQNQEEQHLDKICGGLEAEYEKKVDILHQICEENIIRGQNLLANYRPWIEKIVQDILLDEFSAERNKELDRVAVLAFSKFMCVSKKYCEQNLMKLFQLLESPKTDHILKINIIISLGDLLHKYPNLVEPFNQKIFAKLHDQDLQVRKTTMMVLTHLILNDMMKIKGEICEVALLLEDPEPQIQNIVKLFLHELHKKDSKIIYNLLPEAIGRMSRCEKTELGAIIKEDTFINFAKNIMQYLEKEKFSESLVEKLCLRFINSNNEREWINCSFCLSQLSYNEKGIRKLLEFYESYREKLTNNTIMENFQGVLSKLKRMQKQELKSLIEEFESKILSFQKENFENSNSHTLLGGLKKKEIKKKPINKIQQQGNQQQLQSKRKINKQKKKNNSDFEDGNEVVIKENNIEKYNDVGQGRNLRKKIPNKMIIEDDEEDFEDPIDEEEEEDDEY
ncbi:hypothetical protein IMG5_193940 [Ichthyophthirius multifiliis]|uniref:Condensin complex subunit 1 C-terminal domain-containing protein n=1 Tax=Ichthyophthirius multifiliis TaxID=5932 RepID=G0R4N4_ICHMU|nr:hypothetical protein IMG5_193940 [Ichthyophthirius multifiliis]EGR27594.1 hypothetical protein IMG5_193940 [Ichthyophthirius multifiliis]|eukprot:XP_004025046.1 hypothetical protein IMG5_193940 [Ichthyophthirius multifiliis]